jgi:hypothetical protein
LAIQVLDLAVAMEGRMKRREFMGLVAGGIAWPVVAEGQQQTNSHLLREWPPADSDFFLNRSVRFDLPIGATVRPASRNAQPSPDCRAALPALRIRLIFDGKSLLFLAA